MTRSALEKFLCAFVLWIVLAACEGPVTEPVATGHYLIDNRTGLSLRLETDEEVFDQVVPPDTVFNFYTIEVSTGGSVAPYQILDHFRVVDANAPDSILYEGNYLADGEDWHIAGAQTINGTAGTTYVLIIPR
ncbi:hypothetical protein AB9P05_24540 [Roseivirga sp. BDSF3-8]|uniref:hypothetical protein n=1 Tax=Roseivirga sp. BDSF3-8 TaxID=3241598 RepID=UPI003532412C